MGTTVLTATLVLGAAEETSSKRPARDASYTPTLVHTPLWGEGAETPSHMLAPLRCPSLHVETYLLGFSLSPSFHQVLSESDLDNDNMLSFSEFEHAMAKSPDFMK